MKKYDEVLSYIHSLGMFSQPAGLERITRLLNLLGKPQNSFYSVHIAGTNGKGSVATMMTCALMNAGYKVGTFVSPYIVDFRERIQVGGEYITKEALVRLSEQVRECGICVTEFEFITAVGFLYFAECGCDVCVCETGLGGRLDATNTLPVDAFPVITKIGLDHTSILGDSIEKIAQEKCGIIKEDIAVTCYGQTAQALNVIKQKAPNLIVADEGELEIISCSIFKNRFKYKGLEYETRLGGAHQIQNALTAIEALYAMRLDVDYTAVYEGLKNAVIPARLEVIKSEPLTVIDGAHNPDGAEVLSEAMKPYSGRITAIVGMMRDKSVEEFLTKVLPHCKNVIAVRAAQNERSLSAEELKQIACKYHNNVTCEESLERAIKTAKAMSGGDPVFAFGSLYLASQIRNY